MHKGEKSESHRKYRRYALRYPLFFGIYLGEHIYHNAQMNPAIAVWSKPHSGYAPKQRESTEPKGSDANTPRRGVSYSSKLGISALQIFRFECSDTHLGRGFHPYNPKQKGEKNEGKR